MTDSEVKIFRRFLDQHLPEEAAHTSNAEIAGIGQLMNMIGNPAAAASLIAAIDPVLDTRDSQSDAHLCNGSIGVKFESPVQARSFLRQFRALLTGDRSPSSNQMAEPCDEPNDKEHGQLRVPTERPRRAPRHRTS